MPHPSYPNAQLVEALCEIHFSLSPADPWKPTKPGELFKAIQENYPEIEPVTEIGIKIEIGKDSAPVQHMMPSRIRFKFKHKNRPLFLQISEQTFTINALKPYPGWEAVKGELAAVWPRVSDIIKPVEISRIGMRYINRIARKEASEKPSFWLRANDQVPASFLRSDPTFFLRVDTRMDPVNRIAVTGAFDDSEKSEPFGALVFDIDRICERKLAPTWKELEAVLEGLHEDVWRVFESARGPHLEELLLKGQN